MTNEKPQKVFAAYTPFRNHLRKANLESSLRAIHAHIQHQLFGQKLPSYIINVPWGYGFAKSFKEFINFQLFPWELEIIAKELIINAETVGGTKTLENWNYLAAAVNKLKNLENEIIKIYLDKNKVLRELHRVAHRQFKFQVRPNLEILARYWKIYKYPDLKDIIYKTIKLTIEEIYLIGLALTGFYLKKFALDYPPKIKVKHIEIEHLDKFIKHFGVDFTKLKEMLTNEQQLNEKYTYAFNSLKRFPIIKMEYSGKDSLICPIPPLLYERLASGIYYEICNQPGFDKSFGDSFQSYIGEALSKGNKKARLLPEERYGRKNSKRTVDWIMKDNTGILFIECKTKRLTLDAKIELLSHQALEEQLGKMADFIIQVYKTLVDYEKNKYPQLKFDPKNKVYPVITTLEEWYLFGDELLPILEKKVLEQLKKSNLPQRLLKTYPYSVCSTSEIEEIAQVSEKVGISKVFREKVTDPKMRMWPMANYAANKFPNEVNETKSLFTEELNKYIESQMLKE